MNLDQKKIPVEVSARHVHLSLEVANVIFGENYQFSKRKDLSQPGQFACNERVDIQGPKGIIKNVAVLGPLRNKTQVEISLTDTRKLGVECFIRESGDLSGTTECVLIGPKGKFKIPEGLIVAKRHIHMTPADAENFNFSNGENVKVKIAGEERSLIFEDVVVRVSDKFSLAMHIDTDEGNAAEVKGNMFGTLI